MKLFSHVMNFTSHHTNLILVFPQLFSILSRTEIQPCRLIDHVCELPDRFRNADSQDNTDHRRKNKCHKHGSNDELRQTIRFPVNL